MNNLLKGFLGIIFSCFGMGLSMQLADLLQLLLVFIFIVIDAIGISYIWLHSRNYLWDVFYTFCPAFATVKLVHFEYPFIVSGTDFMFFSLEYSFVLALLGILGWWVVLLYERIRWTKIYQKERNGNLVPFFLINIAWNFFDY